MAENKYENMCFVIMPIGETGQYPEEDHFRRVYEDILVPAIRNAGYIPKRADDGKASNLIQMEIIKDIVNAPMVVCDLSSRNPNVLFELGIRQAFDLPVVLVQETGTPRIFDIMNFNTIDYDGKLTYRGVLTSVKDIQNGIVATKDTSNGVNSIIRLLRMEKAEVGKPDSVNNENDIQMMLYSLSSKMDKIEKTIENNSLLNTSGYLNAPIFGTNYIFSDDEMKLINGNYGSNLKIAKDGRLVCKAENDDKTKK